MRNHWKRDTVLGEDGSRSRHPNLLANVALLRSAVLAVLAEHHPQEPLLPLLEHFHAQPHHGLRLLRA